jgi:hypothetical protein
MGLLINTLVLNFNIMDWAKFMVIIHGRPFQMLKQTFPCKEKGKQLWISQLWHITPNIKLLN